MLERSEEAKRLSSTFLTYRNDIDIYTEDEEKDKEFYKTVFKRLLNDDIQINDITPLGSRSNVLERCKAEPQNGRKKIFLIDGDVSIIHGDNIPVLDNLFVLDAYCIENFLLDKETIIQFIYLNCATKPREVIEQEIDFEEWILTYSEDLIELFIHFAIADSFDLRYKLYNAHKYHIRNKDDSIFSVDLVQKDIQELKLAIVSKVGIEDYKKKKDYLKNRWSSCSETLFTVVSGKDYLIPILLFKTQVFKQSKSLPTLEEVKLSLAQYASLQRLNKLKETIESL